MNKYINKSKIKSKIKWWYVVPVILIVATAGYFIVRFSQASSRKFIKNTNSGLSGDLTTFKKAPWPLKLVTSTLNRPVLINFGKLNEIGQPKNKTSVIAGKQICAYVWASNNNMVWKLDAKYFNGNSFKPVSLSIVNGLFSFSTLPASWTRYSAGNSSATSRAVNLWDIKCIKVPSKYGKTIYDKPYFAEVRIYPTTPGQFGVAEVWVQ